MFLENLSKKLFINKRLDIYIIDSCLYIFLTAIIWLYDEKGLTPINQIINQSTS